MEGVQPHRALVLVACLAMGGCDPLEHAIQLELLTDLVPGGDFTQLVLVDESTDATIGEVNVDVRDFRGADWVRTPATFPRFPVDGGEVPLRVSLRDRTGAEVIGLSIHVLVEGRTGVSVALHRSCLDLECGDESCVGGRCVPRGCLTGAEPECPAAACTSDTECQDEADLCMVDPICRAGACFGAVSDDACDEGDYCDPTRGCVTLGGPVGIDGGTDAGPDAGFDAGRDAGTDAGRDAGFDAGRDAGFNAGPVIVNQLHVDATWTGGGSIDMDLHLLDPAATMWSDSTYDCFYRNCVASSPDWGVATRSEDDPRLVDDVIDGRGPEHIYIDAPASGTYRVGIHAYAGQANVRGNIECGGTVHSFGPVRVSEGELWRVADVTYLDGACSVFEISPGSPEFTTDTGPR